MNRLLRVAAVIEAAAGLALMAVPSVVARLLLGVEISAAGIPLGRVAGFGLLALGMACWPGRDPTGKAAPALRAMLTYNSLATLYLMCLGIGGQWVGPLLWPAVVLHAAMTVWCVACLPTKPARTTEKPR
ncbi:MAG: hypothetical protein ABSG86_16930 [Thermoguttaceae bacterium]|jgi:hypothetical protein